MKNISVFSIFIVSTVAFCQTQQITVADLLKGDKLPTLIKAQDLSADYRAVRIGSSDPSSNPFSMLMPFMFMGMAMGGASSANDSSAPMFELMNISEMSWTKGETITFAGSEFLITYRLPLGMSELASMSPSGGSGKQISSDLKLTLVKLSSIEVLSPAPDITKEKLVKLFEMLTASRGADAATVEVPPKSATSSDATVPSDQVEAAKKAQSVSNSKQIALSIIMYSSDYDDQLPYVQGTHALRFITRPYLKNDSIWLTLNPNGGQFLFNMSLAGVMQYDIENPAETPLIYDSNEWPTGFRIVAFADGHVKSVSRNEWMEISALLKLNLKRKGKPLPMNTGSDWKPKVGG